MISLTAIQKGARLIRKGISRTPLVYSPILSRRFGGSIYLKLENLQKTGSFKLRGATYKILTHRKAIGEKGVVAASAGNHAQGVAMAAREAGMPATLVMPSWASISKQEATIGHGGEVLLAGDSIGESIKKAREIAAASQRMFIHPFDDPDIVTGQGTIGLEILQDLEGVAAILVPVGGGGLISGVACAAKALNPAVNVIGVQAAACPAVYQSIQAGKPKQVRARPSIADGIAVKQPGEFTLPVIRRLVDRIVLVEEEQIAAAILMLLEQEKILAEGAGAAVLAALVNGAVVPPEKGHTVLLVSGGNVDPPLLGRIIDKGLLKNGRIMNFKVYLADVPGSLARLLSLLARLQANVLHITHHRHLKDLSLYASSVELEVETRNFRHIDEISAELARSGYEIIVE